MGRFASGRHAEPGRHAGQAWRGWYDLAIWRAPKTGLRAHQLAKEPRCERHLARGKLVLADTVNHRQPHKGDWALFIDPKNHESVCKLCHDSVIAAEEARGYRIGSDVMGRPIDPKHPWNRTAR